MGYISAIISLVRLLMDLVKFVRGVIADREEAKAVDKEQAVDKAVDKIKTAGDIVDDEARKKARKDALKDITGNF